MRLGTLDHIRVYRPQGVIDLALFLGDTQQGVPVHMHARQGAEPGGAGERRVAGSYDTPLMWSLT